MWEGFFTPAKRRWGYYVLPIIFGDRFVGRIEPRIDRDRARVEVLNVWWEDGFAPRRADGFVDAMRDALRAYLRFAGADRLDWAPHLATEKRLFLTQPVTDRRAGLPSPLVAEGVVIRPERDADHSVIAEVVRAAFVGHPDEVASFVARIRASEQFIPELALVAEDSSGVIAHVMLSWVGVEGGSRTRILNLTPMSVRPDRQRIGVGSRLIRDALGRAEEAGEPAVMVEGIAAYYPRFGFEQASALGFISPHPKIPDEAFMVKRLPGYSPDLAGRIVYPTAFDALGY